MLVQKALRELDGEIARLSQIRAIVATLHSSQVSAELSPQNLEAAQAQDAMDAEETEEGTESVSAVPQKRTYRKLRFERSTRTRRSAPPMARALGGTIPAKPVFIASAKGGPLTPVVEAPQSRAQAASKSEGPVEGLEALLRELSFRPNAQRA